MEEEAVDGRAMSLDVDATADDAATGWRARRASDAAKLDEERIAMMITLGGNEQRSWRM